MILEDFHVVIKRPYLGKYGYQVSHEGCENGQGGFTSEKEAMEGAIQYLKDVYKIP